MASTWATNGQVNFEANVPKELKGVVRIEADDNTPGRYTKTPFSNSVKGFRIPAGGEVDFRDIGETVWVKFDGNCSVEVGYA